MTAYYKVEMYLPSADYEDFVAQGEAKKWAMRINFPFELRGSDFVPTLAVPKGLTDPIKKVKSGEAMK